MAQLPEELWSLVCEQLRPKSYKARTRDLGFHTLRNVCLTSKACYVAAKPHLYHALDFEGPRINRLRPVLRVLLRHPRLCKLVKSLHVTTWKTEYDRGPIGTSNMVTDIEGDLAVSWEALDLGLSSADALRLTLAVRARIQDAELALLLISHDNVNPYNCQRGTLKRASRLKSLAIPAWALFCHGDEEEFDLEHRLDMVLPLSLEVLEIEWADDDVFLGDDELLVAMINSGRFANLKQILIDREADFTGNREGLQWEHRPSDGHRVEVRRLH
nr:hypothetical protein B0A51_00684 [Rachicladosporium sp. CCFEE 5018]